MRRNAFSLAEVLITLIMTGVLVSMMAISVKQIANYEKLAKPAYNNLLDIVTEALSASTTPGTLDANFCQNVLDVVNFVTPPATSCADGADVLNVTLPNKMQMYGMGGATYHKTIKIDLNGSENSPNMNYRDIVFFNVFANAMVVPDAGTQKMIHCKVIIDSIKSSPATVEVEVRKIIRDLPGWTNAKAVTYIDSFFNNSASNPIQADKPILYSTYDKTKDLTDRLNAEGASANNICY